MSECQFVEKFMLQKQVPTVIFSLVIFIEYSSKIGAIWISSLVLELEFDDLAVPFQG
jgi:hypothetical protein